MDCIDPSATRQLRADGTEVWQMNKTTASVLALGLLLSMCTHARAAQVVRSRWVIVLTLIDLSTGKKLEERKLDPRLQFDDLRECKSVLSLVGPIASSNHFGAVLTCRKV